MTSPSTTPSGMGLNTTRSWAENSAQVPSGGGATGGYTTCGWHTSVVAFHCRSRGGCPDVLLVVWALQVLREILACWRDVLTSPWLTSLPMERLASMVTVVVAVGCTLIPDGRGVALCCIRHTEYTAFSTMYREKLLICRSCERILRLRTRVSMWLVLQSEMSFCQPVVVAYFRPKL